MGIWDISRIKALALTSRIAERDSIENGRLLGLVNEDTRHSSGSFPKADTPNKCKACFTLRAKVAYTECKAHFTYSRSPYA